jgi:membrane fusion protein (multidrug efflux system)
VVLDGLKAGEQVMVDGFQKLQMMPPGTPVKAVPWQPAGATPPAGAASAPAAGASAPAATGAAPAASGATSASSASVAAK